MKRFREQSGFVAEHTQKQDKKIIKLQAENERLKKRLDSYVLLEECSPPDWPREDFVEYLFNLWNEGEIQKLQEVIMYFEGCLPDEISDGFGSTISAKCPACGYKALQVVRPGKFQCGLCNSEGLKE